MTTLIENNYQALKHQRNAYVQNIRDFCESQVDIWKQIPWWALQAEGISGYNDNYQRAYAFGFWAVQSSNRQGGYTVYVNCPTGELVSSWPPHKPSNPANIIGLKLVELCAQPILDNLIKYSKEPVSKYIAKQKPNWREKLVKEYGLVRY